MAGILGNDGEPGWHASWPRPDFQFCRLYLTTCLSPSHPQRKPKITASRKLLLKVRLHAGPGGTSSGRQKAYGADSVGVWRVVGGEEKGGQSEDDERTEGAPAIVWGLVVSEWDPESMGSWHLPGVLKGGSNQLQGDNTQQGRGPCFILARVSWELCGPEQMRSG